MQNRISYYCNYAYDITLDEKLLIPLINLVQNENNNSLINITKLTLFTKQSSEVTQLSDYYDFEESFMNS